MDNDIYPIRYTLRNIKIPKLKWSTWFSPKVSQHDNQEPENNEHDKIPKEPSMQNLHIEIENTKTQKLDISENKEIYPNTQKIDEKLSEFHSDYQGSYIELMNIRKRYDKLCKKYVTLEHENSRLKEMNIFYRMENN